jgi:hypothetical protein
MNFFVPLRLYVFVALITDIVEYVSQGWLPETALNGVI